MRLVAALVYKAMLEGFLPSIHVLYANEKTLMSPCLVCEWRFMRPMYLYKFREAKGSEKKNKRRCLEYM
jgi:hypothetical protein